MRDPGIIALAPVGEGRSASDPSLTFSDTASLTIFRRRAGRTWSYFADQGKRVRDPDEIARLNAIGLPPAYVEARFNPDPVGHLQAVGIDARGRRQYRYHPLFRAAQEATKFSRCEAFGLALPALRRQLDHQLSADPVSRDAVLAAVVRILDTAYLRIGNESYSRTNKSFGLTTLRNRHLRMKRQAAELQYRGKSGIMRTVRLSDRSLLRIVRRCQDLPGQYLFQYRDADGEVRPVTSNAVNAYLRETMAADFTAKHFRTWHASVIAFAARREGATIKATAEQVAQALGNTPAIARKSYIHPRLLEETAEAFGRMPLPRATRYLSALERGFLQWLSIRSGGNG